MSDRRTVLGAIVLALYSISTISGCGGGASAAYSTPQATFDTAKAAAAKEDWKAFAQCLTPDTRDEMAGGMAIFGPLMGLSDPETGKQIEGVLKKHGIDEKAMDGPPLGDAKGSPEEAMKKLASSIKDRDAFIGEMMTIMKKSGKMKDKGPMDKTATLKDVKIEGDKATGTLVTKVDGKDVPDPNPVKFRKIEGAWKMDVDMNGGGGGPPGGGPPVGGGADPEVPKLKTDDFPIKTDDPPKTGDTPKAGDK
jgi:hypothetical protein